MSLTQISVKLAGENGNAFYILGRCRQALRDADRLDLWPDFKSEATAGDYNRLLQTVMKYFNVDTLGKEDDMN